MAEIPTEQERLDNQWYNMHILGRNLYRLRKEKNLTQLELALRAGINDYQISKIENCRYYNVSFKTICLIARALDIPTSELIAI